MLSDAHLTFANKLYSLPHRLTPPPRWQTFNAGGLFVGLLQQQLGRQAGAEAAGQAVGVIDQYTQAVQLARRAELETARAGLVRADQALLELPVAVVSFATLFQPSSWGYYHYRTGHPELAVQALLEGLHRSTALEHQGYYPLLYRRVEQLRNIARIYRPQQPILADQLLRDTLRFSHSGHVGALLTDDWDGRAITRIRSLQESVLRDSVQFLAQLDTQAQQQASYDPAYYYQAFYRDLLRELDLTTASRRLLHSWLLAKAAYAEQGLPDFLDQAADFLAATRGLTCFDELKANVLVQALRSLTQDAGGAWRAGILAFAATELPAKLVSSVEKASLCCR